VHRHGPGDLIGIKEAVGQLLDVAVEDEPHHLRIPVDHRTPRVPADDVVGGHEIERLSQVEPVLVGLPPFGELEWRLAVECGRAAV
jgi:hypothetical protein